MILYSIVDVIYDIMYILHIIYWMCMPGKLVGRTSPKDILMATMLNGAAVMDAALLVIAGLTGLGVPFMWCNLFVRTSEQSVRY